MCLSPKGEAAPGPTAGRGEGLSQAVEQAFLCKEAFWLHAGLTQCLCALAHLMGRALRCVPPSTFHTASFLGAGGESWRRTAHFPLASRSLWYGLPCRLFVQVVPDYHYQTSHCKNPKFLRFELKEWWHDRLTFSYFTPLHAPMLFSTTSI